MKKAVITLKQKLTFDALLRKIADKEKWSISDLMVEGGYSKITAHNPGANLTNTEGWQKLLSTISDETILATIYKAMLSEDTRSSL